MKDRNKAVKVDLKNNVAILTLNNPPVNQLSEAFSREIDDAINQAFQNQEVKALIITGTDKNFIAGADIIQIKGQKQKETVMQLVLENDRFLNGIEEGPKPVIAAINGNCLGGGLEIAMACHYRIAARGAKVGLPEVQLGLIPGGGGTQRLPRLIGLPSALEMITTGQTIPAEKGEDRGLIDEVVSSDQLLEKALKAAGRFISGQVNHQFHITRNRYDRLPSASEKKAVLGFFRKIVTKKARGYIAPFKAIDAIEQGLSYDFQADIEAEADLFSDCAISEIAKNLISIFLNTRAAGRLPQIRTVKPNKIQKVAILGGGVMGSGIVNLLLRYGFDTCLWDINEEAVKKGVKTIRKTFSYAIKKRKMTEKALDRLMKEHFITTLTLDELKNVDLVIEAVVEDINVKQDIWKRLESICRSDVVFGTNTSALPITEIASVLGDPGRIIGLHFFNPAERMQLLEIICGKETSDETLSTSVAFAKKIQKVPIVVNDGPGFYVSRQLTGLMGEAIFLIAEGAHPASVDEAMLEFGMPMGPAALIDLTGIDIGYHVSKNFERSLGERWRMSPLYEQIYRAGCYGRKTGAGWYDYSGEKPVLNQKILDIVDTYLKENGISSREMSNKEIVAQMLARAINEAAYMIQEGICDRPQDMDLAMIYGTGFPPYRGGILRYADVWGINNVFEQLLKLEKEKGIRFRPAALLAEMAETGKSFYNG